MVSVMPEITLRGTPLSPGIALGKACFYWQAARHPDKVFDSTQDQAARLQNALAWMDQRLETLTKKAEARLDQETADIFRMHRLMLKSESLRQQFFEAITVTGVSAERVIENQLAPYQTQLLTADDSYLRERAADLAELKQGLLGCLQGMEPLLRCKDSAACELRLDLNAWCESTV
jgi:phosphoenolpyruvate-protein kinase (PTS system EI component)